MDVYDQEFVVNLVYPLVLLVPWKIKQEKELKILVLAARANPSPPQDMPTRETTAYKYWRLSYTMTYLWLDSDHYYLRLSLPRSNTR